MKKRKKFHELYIDLVKLQKEIIASNCYLPCRIAIEIKHNSAVTYANFFFSFHITKHKGPRKQGRMFSPYIIKYMR